jgi:hypothetical protein
MRKRTIAALVTLIVIATIFGFASCTQFAPYRTTDPNVSVACESDTQGRLPQEKVCQSASWESDPDYDLLFAEFDDQGLLHPNDERDSGNASQQIDAIDKALRTQFKGNEINLIVYVHGWKHNARGDDDDVKAFRQLLHSVKSIEAVSDEIFGVRVLEGHPVDPRKVVGVYVGWRGLSSSLEPLKELSFWGRKETATRIAVGSARELFSRLWAYEKMRNDAWDKLKLASANALATIDPIRDATSRPPVQMLIVGHSFGAQLVFSALAENLIEALSSQLSDPDARIRRYGDMVVLINPAFEANRYIPLLRVARGRGYDHYLAPLLVTVTTTNDWATGLAFPFGRWFGTRFEHYSSAAERQDALHAIGHLPVLITHQLSVADDSNDAICKNWKIPGSGQSARRILEDDIKLEGQAAANFFQANQAIVDGHQKAVLPAKWTRHFCGGMKLNFVKGEGEDAVNGNMPIWNVETEARIIDGHNGFKTDRFFAFVRQLRADSVEYVAITSPSGEAINTGVTADNKDPTYSEK